MVVYLRIKKVEDELLERIKHDLNKQRIEHGKQVMKDSEIFHDLLIKALENCKIEKGELII